MAMCTYLQLVSDQEIARLVAEPATINNVDKPASETFRTYHFAAINYFLTGSAYPSKKRALGALLCGETNVATSTLENGSFDVTSAATAAKLAAKLANVNVAELKAKVAAADLEQLRDDEEVDEEHALEESGDAPGELAAAVEELKTFFAAAAAARRGVVIYTA